MNAPDPDYREQFKRPLTAGDQRTLLDWFNRMRPGTCFVTVFLDNGFAVSTNNQREAEINEQGVAVGHFYDFKEPYPLIYVYGNPLIEWKLDGPSFTYNPFPHPALNAFPDERQPAWLSPDKRADLKKYLFAKLDREQSTFSHEDATGHIYYGCNFKEFIEKVL